MAQETVSKQLNAEQISTLKTTTSPREFAEVIRRGAQMDLTCVEAVPEALKELNINIPNLAINVFDESGNTYRYGSRMDSMVIELDLSNNHFQLRGGPKLGQSSNIRAGNNDCLFESLAQAIPQLLGVSGEEFREKLAECIESNPDIRRHIQLGKHQDLLQRGLFGGDVRGRRVDRDEGKKDRKSRSKSPFVQDDPTMKTSALEHLLARFYAIFDMAGAIQGTAEHLGIPRSEVVQGGRSRYQDRSSSYDGYQAAHVMRIQITDRASELLRTSNAALNEHLITRIGYTDLVESWANMWGGIGQNIDELTYLLLRLLEVVDFSQNSPRIMENYSLEFLQETVDWLNILLQRIDRGAEPISLPDQGLFASLFTNNEITADTIIEICKASLAIAINKWLKANAKHFMNTDSNKKVLKQLLTAVMNSNNCNLLQLGRDAYKLIAQVLSAKPKCGTDRTDKDNDKDNGNGGVSSKGNKASSVTNWGTVKEMAKTEAARCHVEPSSFLTTASWILLGIGVTIAIGFVICMAAPAIISFLSQHVTVIVCTVVAG